MHRGARVRRRLLVLALVSGLLATVSGTGASAFEAAVWNGTVVRPGEHRSVAILDVVVGRCSGTLIKPRWVLTAAHCLSETPAVPVTLGLDGVRVRDGFGEVFTTRLHTVHPRWSFSTGRNDFALLYLRRPSALPPVKLATAQDTELYKPGTDVQVVGWGLTDSRGSGGNALRAGWTTVAPNALCAALYAGYSNAHMMCADGGGGADDTLADACQGDSGGPLIATKPDGAPRIVGVTSFGDECDRSQAGVYARIPAGLEWINATIAAGRPARVRTGFFGVDAPSRVAKGRDVVIRGRLGRAPGGRGLMAQKVQLLRKRVGTGTWRVAGRAWSQDGGHVRFVDDPRHTVVYRLRHVRTYATTATASDNLRVRVVR